MNTVKLQWGKKGFIRTALLCVMVVMSSSTSCFGGMKGFFAQINEHFKNPKKLVEENLEIFGQEN